MEKLVKNIKIKMIILISRNRWKVDHKDNWNLGNDKYKLNGIFRPNFMHNHLLGNKFNLSKENLLFSFKCPFYIYRIDSLLKQNCKLAIKFDSPRKVFKLNV
jgi:hypothetical protein